MKLVSNFYWMNKTLQQTKISIEKKIINQIFYDYNKCVVYIIYVGPISILSLIRMEFIEEFIFKF